MAHVLSYGSGSYDGELAASFGRLRKRTFHDHLKWEVELSGDRELDQFDVSPHLLVVEAVGREVVAGMRLMQMSAPTLLSTRFSYLLPDGDDFRSPNIWEVSRYCIDMKRINEKTPSGANALSIRLSYASLVATRERGGTHHIAVVDRRIMGLIRLFGAQVEILAEARSESGMPIVCGIWPIDDTFLERMSWIRERHFPERANIETSLSW